jgi:hypothetical protein
MEKEKAKAIEELNVATVFIKKAGSLEQKNKFIFPFWVSS